MKVNFKDGRSGFFKEGETLNSETTSYLGGFGLILKKGALSYFDEIKDEKVANGKALFEGVPVYLPAWKTQEDNPLKEGDEVISWEMKISCWTTDCPASMSEGTVDITSQCDTIKGAKDIRPDGNVTESGTINGYYETESEMQRALEDKFISSIEDKKDKKTFVPRNNNEPLWHFFIQRETEVVGETETVLIRKMFISGISEGQGSSGYTPFTFNYTTLESYNYRREV